MTLHYDIDGSFAHTYSDEDLYGSLYSYCIVFRWIADISSRQLLLLYDILNIQLFYAVLPAKILHYYD